MRIRIDLLPTWYITSIIRRNKHLFLELSGLYIKGNIE